MTESGYRSLLLFLERRQYLFREKIFGAVSIGITDEGRKAVLALFPALAERWASWNGQWMMLVFLDAPKSDPNFRYLRQALLAEKSLPLSRGVYLAADSFSDRVLTESKQLYSHSVAILSAERWLVGFERPLIVKYYDLTSRVETYSGISDEVCRLLGLIEAGKKLTDQQKTKFGLLFERYIDCLKDDPGFTSYYFPDSPGVLNLLHKAQQILKL
jgi:DNA-binding transcriptional regulator PaaX